MFLLSLLETKRYPENHNDMFVMHENEEFYFLYGNIYNLMRATTTIWSIAKSLIVIGLEERQQYNKGIR